ncbi:hypothetical protein F4680DRAFT_467658 [Xylaria scruposa]|nr:hypothetical protein F4680DRAFT_467658 [Xylaria scruposa]
MQCKHLDHFKHLRFSFWGVKLIIFIHFLISVAIVYIGLLADCKYFTAFYVQYNAIDILTSVRVDYVCNGGCLVQQRTLRELRSAIRPRSVTRPKPKYWNTEALKKTKTTIRLEDGTLVEIQNPYAELELDPSSQPQEGDVIEVRPTPPDVDELAQKPLTPSEEDTVSEEDGGDDDSALNIKGTWDGVQEGGETLSRAERRRRIKAEIQRLSQGDTPVYWQRRLW